ncbi:MAG: hypothetical protein ACI9D8_000419, partial [Reinekea sp.]
MRICSFANTATLLSLLVLALLQGCATTVVAPPPVTAVVPQVIIAPASEAEAEAEAGPMVNQQITTIEDYIAQQKVDEARILLHSLSFNQL